LSLTLQLSPGDPAPRQFWAWSPSRAAGHFDSIMKILFTSEAISKGGRSGTLTSPDGLLNTTLGNPLEKGAGKRGPNPELLFAGAYSACYHGALGNAAKKLGVTPGDSTVRALVSLVEDDQGGYRLAVELRAHLPEVDLAQVQKVMEEAHKTCPYSKALRGNTSVKLVAE
jgi:Ohr subfamily peroxiredoxin